MMDMGMFADFLTFFSGTWELGAGFEGF